MSQGILYISYDGMLEPLGQSQVLAYLEKLAPGRRVHLMSFEKAHDWQDQARRDALANRIAQSGIEWHPLRYHKRPTIPATFYDVVFGSARAIAIVKKHGIGIVHARSYVAALIALVLKDVLKTRFLFDMRGLWADERVDGGLWRPGGYIYRRVKRLERRFLLAADHVVTLTHASESEIRDFDYLQEKAPPISVIPTCADLDRFTIQGPPQRQPFTLGYIGSVGTWYLLDEMLRCFRISRELRPDARLLIVNRADQSLIRERASALGIAPAAMEIVAADHGDMPQLIGRMSAGMALIKPVYSKIASAPTKLAEYLGCGVPCLGNARVGDMVDVLEGKGTGIALPGFEEAQIQEGISRLLKLVEQPGLQQRCRDAAAELFSLDQGVAAYDSIYQRLASR